MADRDRQHKPPEGVGIEIIVEPDVVPKGTINVRGLDAPHGAKPPLRRIEADGRVFMIDAPTAPTVVAPTVVAKVETKVETPVEPAEPLGLKLRKKSLHSDEAMPPRPASAEHSASGRISRDSFPADDYETAQISGGFGSALWTLLKVTAVLAFFTLATVFTALKWSGFGTSPVAVLPPGNNVPLKKPDKSDVAPVPTQAETAKIDSNDTVAPPVSTTEPEVARSDENPKVTANLGHEPEYDWKAVEQLRREAVDLDRKGKYEEAIAKLDEILAKRPKDGDAHFRRALITHKKGDLDGAIKGYEIAAELASAGDARALNNLGLALEQRNKPGDLAAAKAAYKRGLDRDHEDPNILTNTGRLEEDQDPKSALQRYEQALDRQADHPQARYHRAALLALRLDRIDEGKKELEKLLDSPVRGQALDALGEVAIREGRYAEAEKYLRDALKSGSLDARLYLGVALWAQEKAQPAADELKTYLEKNPRSSDGWKTLGAVLVRLDQLQDAKQAYEKAIAINDKDADTLYNYALCAERFGNFLFAIQEYERVVQLDPNQWKALQNLGRLYRNAGREEKALEYFKRAIVIRPNEAELYLHEANSLVALKKDAEARYALEKFVKLAPPTDPRVAQARRAIDSQGPLRPANVGALGGDKPNKG
jgi:tetratricopeptide (TPR) repeat protein